MFVPEQGGGTEIIMKKGIRLHDVSGEDIKDSLNKCKKMGIDYLQFVPEKSILGFGFGKFTREYAEEIKDTCFILEHEITDKSRVFLRESICFTFDLSVLLFYGGKMIYGIPQKTYFACLSKYFCLVAIPPRMCRSALFSSRILCTLLARRGFIVLSLSVISLCTVVVKMILFVKPYVGQ